MRTSSWALIESSEVELQNIAGARVVSCGVVDKAFLPRALNQLLGSARLCPPENGLVPALHLAPAARAHHHTALCFSAARRALGGRRSPSAGASRGGR